jgi:cobalt-zinc-cadmium efflux system outer membrane protein
MLRFFLLFLTPLALPAETLSLAEALRRAEAGHPVLAAEGYAGRAAEALIEQAAARPNPTLDLALENVAGTGALGGAERLETTVQVSRTLERGGKRENRIALARGERDLAGQALAVRRAEVAAATAAAYIAVLAAQERLALSATALTLAHDTAEAAALRVKDAAAPAAESARARVSLASARAEHARIEAALAGARAVLAATWGGEASEVPALSGTLAVPSPLPEYDTLLARLASHPRLAQQQAGVSRHRASLQLALSQASPDVTVAGGVRFLSGGSDAAFVAGVSVPLPFRGQNQGNIRAAREILAGTEQATRVVQAELRTGFNTAWRDLRSALVVAEELRANALPAAEEALSLVRHAHAGGELPLLDVVESRRALVGLRRDLLDADIAAATALVALDALTDPSFPLTTALLSKP